MFLITQIKKDTSIGNFTWGGGVLLLTLYSFFQSIPQAMPWGVTPRKILITSLISLWAIRLIVYLYLRYKKGADPRFVQWEASWGKFNFLASFVWVVILQGILMLIMSFPSVLINSTDMGRNLNQSDFIGLLVWIIGFFFESVGDYQLYTFLKNPNNSGKIMDQGLWKYTRHPNYFGEIAMWWGIYLITLSTYDGFYTIIAPVTITILLVFITGVPLTESVFKNNPAYAAYKKRTNKLIPGLPRT
jgi:steroid 5-alpha reductase family enzyme